jgi:hypothetical protein
MELYIDSFRLHVQELRRSGATVTNQIEASILLNGLGDGYDSFTVSTTPSFRQNTEDDDIDVEQLVSQLCDEDRRCTTGKPSEIGDSSIGSALYSN